MTEPSGYPILDNRPIDQWKVTELKEELKRRKLATKGLKEELVKRLDEAIRDEREAAAEEIHNGVNDPEPEVVEQTGKTEGAVIGESETGIPMNAEKNVDGDTGNSFVVKTVPSQVGMEDSAEEPNQEGVIKQKELEKLGQVSSVVVDDQVSESLSEAAMGGPCLEDGDTGNTFGVKTVPSQVGMENSAEEPNQEGVITQKELEKLGEARSVVVDDQVSESLSEAAMGGPCLEDDKSERNNEESGAQQDSVDIKLTHDDVKLGTSDTKNQVSEVDTNLGFPIKCNSVSTDSVSMCAKNELEDNIIADNVQLETDVKPEMVQPSSSDLVCDGGKSHHKDVDKPLENESSIEETKNNVTNPDMIQKNLMGKDELESEQIDSDYNSREVLVRTENSEVTALKEEAPFTTMNIEFPAEEKSTHSEDKDVIASSDKRKLPDQEAIPNSESSKRQRRWKSDGNHVGEPQILNIPSPVAAKDVLPSRGRLSRSDLGGDTDTPKQHEVPPSTKAATNSLRIDNFLRPFTLKAVQELLAKTGTIASFWMDHIKTHCYVTYLSVEDAVATRNAIYNLPWPPNGGRHLVVEFVDPHEVKVRVDPPPPPPSKPAVTVPPATVPEPSSRLPQPSPRKIDLRQQLSKQYNLPPPPPISKPAPAREKPHPSPPPPEDKVEAPFLTLDDLFRKTKSTPRIYYLPLSEQQVSAKLEAQQKNSRQL